ncbi:MAG: hypothetical protein GY937_21730 [bacterium]|nr:hypothetical protein [bacterium]
MSSLREEFIDFKALHLAIGSCRRCQEMGKEVTNLQPPWDPVRGGRKGQKWGMLIGQAPGAQEMEAALRRQKGRRPHKEKGANEKPGAIAFVGPAGKRLRTWLEEAGFTDEEFRSRFYKTAVTKCYPGKARSGSDRRPGVREIDLCRHFLAAEIQLVNPTVLVPMGVSAIQWFFPHKGLDDTVGKKLEWEGRGIVCLPHSSPAAAWWKHKDNAKPLSRAIRRLGKLRQETTPE